MKVRSSVKKLCEGCKVCLFLFFGLWWLWDWILERGFRSWDELGLGMSWGWSRSGGMGNGFGYSKRIVLMRFTTEREEKRWEVGEGTCVYHLLAECEA